MLTINMGYVTLFILHLVTTNPKIDKPAIEQNKYIKIESVQVLLFMMEVVHWGKEGGILCTFEHTFSIIFFYWVGCCVKSLFSVVHRGAAFTCFTTILPIAERISHFTKTFGRMCEIERVYRWGY